MEPGHSDSHLPLGQKNKKYVSSSVSKNCYIMRDAFLYIFISLTEKQQFPTGRYTQTII